MSVKARTVSTAVVRTVVAAILAVVGSAISSSSAAAQENCEITGELNKLVVEGELGSHQSKEEFQLFSRGKLIPVNFSGGELELGRTRVQGSLVKRNGKWAIKPRGKSNIRRASGRDAATCSLSRFQALNQASANDGIVAAASAIYPTGYQYIHSKPQATRKLFLDFDGRNVGSWGGWTNVVARVYDTDGDPNSFSAGELAAIADTVNRVAETYSMFNIDVTNEDPGNVTDKQTAVVAIGGAYGDWYGSSAGGVAYIGGFYNGSPNVGFVFEDNLGGGNSKYCADAAAHEAGHLFGLNHQARWDGATMTESYHSGVNGRAPVMGVAYYVSRSGQWWNGKTNGGVNQEDLSILSNSNNAFGYDFDAHSNSTSQASVIAPDVQGNADAYGIIERLDDADVFTFLTSGGAATFDAVVIPVGPALDLRLDLLDAGGAVIASSNSGNMGESLTATLASGRYFLRITSAGGAVNYNSGLGADLGQFFIAATFPGADPSECVRSASSLALSPATQSANTGAQLNYSLTMTNNDSGACTSSAFALSAADGSGTASATLGSSSMTLAPGASGTTALAVNSSTAGSFTINVAGNDSSIANHGATGSVTAVYQSPDLSAPTIPANMRVVSSTIKRKGKNVTSTVDLAWDASSDDRTPAGSIKFRLFRSTGTGAFVQVTETTTRTFRDNLNKSGTFRYYVVAVDQAGNVSGASNQANFSF